MALQGPAQRRFCPRRTLLVTYMLVAALVLLACLPSDSAKEVGKKKKEKATKQTPCPEDANLWSCVDWCAEVSPGSSATMAGDACSHAARGATAAPQSGPGCMCYDSNFERVLNECTSACPAPVEDSSDSDDDDDDSEAVCPSDGSTCQPSPSLRYLLYDVKMGEGFNLQREIFPRLGHVVALLNTEVKKRCNGTFSTGRCAEWAIVLPPWCRVVHWWSSTEPLPWRTFFDEKALKSSKVKVLEFDEYLEHIGSTLGVVDLAISHTLDRLPASQRYGQRGGFYGWSLDAEACDNKKGPATERSYNSNQKRWQLTYAGRCEGGIQAKDYRCAALSSPFPQDVLDMLSTLKRNVTSVLFKNGDGLMSVPTDEADSLGLREAMLFSEPIRAAGEKFISEAMKGEPYLAVHCRRTDFLKVRTRTTPDAESIVEQVNSFLKEQGLKRVFIATDSPQDIADAAKRTIQGEVFLLTTLPGLTQHFSHPGQKAAVEMWIAARAAFFVGTQESRFTSHIQLERSWLGKPKESSEQEFCKELELEKGKRKRCISPAYRHASRKGSQHRQYWE